MSDAMAEAMSQVPVMPIPQTALELREQIALLTQMINVDLPEVGAFHEGVLVREVDGTRVTADVVVPKGEGPHPVFVFLHGGGWVSGSPKTHNKLVHRFAEGGFLVFNVDYRLSPEHPFPTPFDDCIDAIVWAGHTAPKYGGVPGRLAVGGDSAGGNLTAAAVTTLAGRPDAPKITAAILMYAVLDFGARMAQEVPGVTLEQAERLLEIMVGSYLGTKDRQKMFADPRVSPIHLAKMFPPTHIVCGTGDVLIEQAAALANHLARAGIPHEFRSPEAMPHGFLQLEMLPQAREGIDAMLAFLRKYA